VRVVAIEAVEVDAEEIRARVRIAEPALMRTSARPGLAEAAVALLPGLARHTCDNDEGVSFLQELRDTETAHLVEHVTVELAALAGSPRSLHAATSWDFSADGRGVYRLCFDYDDDLVVLGALGAAAEVVEWLLGGGEERPDVESVVTKLRAKRGC